jgi:hypothetical protein
MKRAPLPELTGDETVFEVPVNDVDMARLMAVCEAHKIDPRMFLASIVHDVLEDDEFAHGDGFDGPDPLVRKHLN